MPTGDDRSQAGRAGRAPAPYRGGPHRTRARPGMPSQRAPEMLPILVDHRRATARPLTGRKPRASALTDPRPCEREPTASFASKALPMTRQSPPASQPQRDTNTRQQPDTPTGDPKGGRSGSMLALSAWTSPTPAARAGAAPRRFPNGEVRLLAHPVTQYRLTAHASALRR